MIDFRRLIKAGAHFGHEKSRWSPKMEPYIWGYKNRVHLIDISKTAYQIEKAAQFLEQVAFQGKQILWVGTKKAAQEIIEQTAAQLDMPFVSHRWIGGTLSNWTQVKKSITKLLHYEDVLARSEKYPHYTKKELNTIQKLVHRLTQSVGGIRNMTWPIGAVFIVDVNREASALKEAVTMGVPVIAIVDTNSDPSFVDCVIPANDDAPQSIQVIVDYVAQAVLRGKETAAIDQEKAQLAQDLEAAEHDESTLLVLEEEGEEDEDRSKHNAKARLAKKVGVKGSEEVREINEKSKAKMQRPSTFKSSSGLKKDR